MINLSIYYYISLSLRGNFFELLGNSFMLDLKQAIISITFI